jgi:hypothetical protein
MNSSTIRRAVLRSVVSKRQQSIAQSRNVVFYSRSYAMDKSRQQVQQEEEESDSYRSLDEIFGREGAEFDRRYKSQEAKNQRGGAQKGTLMDKWSDKVGRHMTRR